MTLHRDHIVGTVLLALAALAYALSGDLPFGTLGSPGPGMLPMIAIALVAAFALAILITARSSPPAGTITWDELPHASAVTVAVALAASVYLHLGFVLTMAPLIFGLLVIVERAPPTRAAIYAVGLSVGVKVLLTTLLKSPLPTGPFGL